jgi:hypothetical protein
MGYSLSFDFDVRSSVRVCRLMMLCRSLGLPGFGRIVCETGLPGLPTLDDVCTIHGQNHSILSRSYH